MEDRIGQLHAQNKVLLVKPDKQKHRRSKIDILEVALQPYHAFTQFFNDLHTEEMDSLRSLALDILWQHFPPCLEDLKDKVGNVGEPGDGLLYDDRNIEEARSILRDLHHAWSNMGQNPSCPRPPKLPNMAMICLVLNGMQQQGLLEDFLDHGVVDEDLPIERIAIERVLKEEHAKYASRFLAEQYRAVPRKWDEGQHLEIEEEEPLPLKPEHFYNHGSYGVVSRVKDPFSGACYARKEQRMLSEDHEDWSARVHLEEERERLRGLSHRHVVRLVKSYQRGRSYGLILEPAATSDLEQLIGRYYKSGHLDDVNRNCKNRDWIRPIFMQAFGCLSKGLAYIHAQKIRHKDVKPANILYEQARNNKPPRLLWADFGLAYDFSVTGNSKTKSTKVYSQRYAAPEILATSVGLVTGQRASVQPDLNRIVEGGEDVVPDALIESAYVDDEENGHGRKTDIFALGCVFLELLACLFDQKLPMDRKAANVAPEPPNSAKKPPEEVQVFSDHIPDLKAWAESVNTTTELSPLLRLAVKMISPAPGDRPTIGDVVRDVAAAGPQYFCSGCWDHSRNQRPKEMNGASHPNMLAASPPPRRSEGNMLQRVDSTPRRRSLGTMLERVNSARPPQNIRMLSREILDKVQSKRFSVDAG